MEGVCIWIGIDDTDSTKGGCTTFVAFTIINRVMERGYNLIGFPRLVRLNPNVPWKTRGNGAVAIHVGVGKGGKIQVGEKLDERLYSHQKNRSDEVNMDDLIDVVEETIEEQAFFSDEKTNPGFVVSKEKPSRELYWKGVKGLVELDEVKNLLKNMGAFYRGYKKERGLIGAAAALAWTPDDRTYELITYRCKERWGTVRHVDEDSVKEMDGRFPSTFDNFDYRNHHNRIVPNSPCPVLYGIRGDDIESLLKAKDLVKSEKYFGWLIFETNQGTDDHLQKKKIGKVKPFESVIVEGEVIGKPRTLSGGHVVFKIKDEKGEVMDCAAYEPTKEFRNVIKQLEIGDLVEVYGGVRTEPFTINLEKINVKKTVEVKKKVENPICPRCGKHMKSIGREAGYRCIRCGLEVDEKQAKYVSVERELKLGFYEVPVCARRHLSKPLKRMEIYRMIK